MPGLDIRGVHPSSSSCDEHLPCTVVMCKRGLQRIVLTSPIGDPYRQLDLADDTIEMVLFNAIKAYA
jgi:hypothetical protein